jgi:transposase
MLTPSPNGARWPEPEPLANPGRFIPGVGPVLAAVFVAEIGDITRFHRPE